RGSLSFVRRRSSARDCVALHPLGALDCPAHLREAAPMLDLLIRGGTVVTPAGAIQADVAIAGERVAAVAEPGAFAPGSAVRIVDASDKLVIPGGIDPHVHCQWPM